MRRKGASLSDQIGTLRAVVGGLQQTNSPGQGSAGRERARRAAQAQASRPTPRPVPGRVPLPHPELREPKPIVPHRGTVPIPRGKRGRM